MIRHPLLLLWDVLIAYGAGVAFWEFSVFFRAEHWSWGGVLDGLIWPWVLLRNRWRRLR